MIDFLRGKVVRTEEARIVLDVNGIGYAVDVPTSTATGAPAAGSEMLLHTELLVREDALQLVGFSSPEQRALYRSLTSVSGIGPKVALKALGAMDTAELAGAIVRGDAAQLTRIPGIGKKTAQILVASLADAVARLRMPDAASRIPAGRSAAPTPSDSEDARLALQALGMDESRARLAIGRALEALGPDAQTAQLVAEALRRA